MKIATSCVCCGSKDLKKSPSVLMPFIAHRIFDIAPVEITDDWDVERYGIKNGMAYARCNSVCCSNCLHTFLDMRFDDDELNLLYDNYREEEYINLRDHYEPGYKQKNEHLNEGYNYLKETEEFISPHLNTDTFTLLDWGGDTGKNTPFNTSCKTFHIYDISERPVMDGAIRVDRQDIENRTYDLLICLNVLEHVSFPSEILRDIFHHMHDQSVLCIEVPYENSVREGQNTGTLDSVYKNKRYWHEHINFFNDKSMTELLLTSGFDVLELRKLKISGETASHVLQVVCKTSCKHYG